ncbi:copper amine oxidase-like protein [Keratinibaculum paraultunense]|uniref:Copper amine oxidase-like protein n=1 Tax=Keratinibaculum paraultunense TaxID=1278232 RepID=A0A4R3KR08_9FIRM|nr:DUF3298 domain-containing protein [Keratinibaculum paraultunense]QQY79731.1 DUF3298 domain-containing protein [Keratinibaculum paraultunense]TCS86960.1 copper amine oxidase-like protein [Keratinibaculum paraultunense]
MNKKIITIGLAGCLIMGNMSVVLADKFVRVNTKDQVINPISINAELKENKVKVYTEVIKPNIDGAEVNIKIPVIKGLKDDHFQEKLNRTIRTSVEKDLKEFKKDIEELKKLNVDWEPQMIVGYDVKSSENILSIVIDNYIFTGGAHGSSRRDYYNIDIDKNKIIQLSDLFKENSDFKSIISDEINKEIKRQIAEEAKSYFTDDEKFITIDDSQDFYIDKDGDIVITFQPYEITPWYMGHPEFKIPSKSIANILKDSKAIIENEVTNFNKIIINDKELELSKPMFKSEKGIVMFPFREVAESLGFKVAWDGKNKVATMNKGPVLAGAYIGEDRYYFSKAFVYLEETSKLIDGTTFVPISFIDQVLQGMVYVTDDGILNIKY